MAPSAIPGLLPGHGLVRITIQGNVLTGSPIAPQLMIDGVLITAKYGANAFQLPAGPHHIELYAQWMRRYGQAAIDVVVSDGAEVAVFYAAPMHQFTTGSIGLVRQRRKGVVFVSVFYGLLLAMVIAGVWFALTLA